MILDLYVVALQGIRISEVMLACQQRVRYTIEKNLEVKVDAVNIFVQGVRTVE